MNQPHHDTMTETAVKQFSATEKDRHMILSDGLMTEIDVLSDYYLAGQNENERTQRYQQILTALKTADAMVFGSPSKAYPVETETSANQFALLHKALIGQMKGYLRYYCQAANEAARGESYMSIVKALRTTVTVTLGQFEAADGLVCPRGTCPTVDDLCVQCPPNPGG